jgi:hypothetical protein
VLTQVGDQSTARPANCSLLGSVEDGPGVLGAVRGEIVRRVEENYQNETNDI